MQYSYSKLIVNLKNIKNNLNIIKKIFKKTICPVIKANAYGLGDIPIANFLVRNKCKDYWVANIIEALKIKKSISNINIYVANGLNKNEEEIFFKNKFIPVLNTYEQFKKWTTFLNKKKNFKKLAIQVDTGMCRSGMQDEDILKVYNERSSLKKFKEVIIFTHLASADEKKSKYNNDQKNKFIKIKSMFQSPNCKFSLAASGGIFLGKGYHFDMVRPGIALYGGKLFFNKKLKNVVSLISPVIQLNYLKKGETAGYNQTYKAKKGIFTATIPLGYADGVKIKISNIGHVYYKNIKLPMIGRISMDLMIIDISKVKNELKIGDYLEVFGKNITLDDFAKISDTSPYDIITSISDRCKKIYVN
ncbi:MAG: alanine racemase [Candidatus Fonsibacter sp.]|nr:alanine racemase [Candidatus Fonsibacter sp.]